MNTPKDKSDTKTARTKNNRLPDRTAVLIPAYEPETAMLILISDLRIAGFSGPFIVVDDGSGPDYQPIFREAERLGCMVLTHPANRGKGAALRTGIQYTASHFPKVSYIVTADADGQHLPKDILRVCREAEREDAGAAVSEAGPAPGGNQRAPALLLGTRDLGGAEVPLRSRLGNSFSALYFRLTTGVRCPDTQTGLRAIPRRLFAKALDTPGDRYEYEMNFLTACARDIRMIPITTVYEAGNGSSHFQTVRDSVRIYRTPLRYIAASLISAGIDLGLFTILIMLFGSGTIALMDTAFGTILAATVIARIMSGSVNFLLNRFWSFEENNAKSGAPAGQMIRYFILFLGIMAASSTVVSVLSILPLPLPLIKAITDTGLAVCSFLVQKNWVFHRAGQPEESAAARALFPEKENVQ